MPPVTAFPPPQFASLLARPGSFSNILATYAGVYVSGRAAVYSAFHALSLPAGSTAWMPSFHCGVEVQAAIDAGLDVGFYRIGPDLTIDLEDLEAKLRARPGPVLAIHYFGFGQPEIASLAEICRRAGVTLIEDCAHALLSRHAGRALGEFAPIAIFSLRKTLPLLEGGALKVNGPITVPLGRRSSAAPFRIYTKYAVRVFVGERLTSAYRRMRWGLAADRGEPVPPNLAPQPSADRISALSQRLAAAADAGQVVERRRRNWAVLEARLASRVKVFENLADGVCPLFLPIWVSDRRAAMMRMTGRGVETFAFGAYPHPRLDVTAFPEAVQLRDRILCLPIHQQMTDQSLERVTAAAGDLERR